MQQGTAAESLTENRLQHEDIHNQYSSVEISNNDNTFCYQFKLWNMAPKDICILVKEDSQILPRLRKGETYNMKYYLFDVLCPAESRKTTIRNVTKDEGGRFRGHYLVHLEILDH